MFKPNRVGSGRCSHKVGSGSDQGRNRSEWNPPTRVHASKIGSRDLERRPPAVPKSRVLGLLLANQDTELTQNHSGRKAASRNSRGRCGGPPCPERHGCQSGVSRPSLISPRRLPVVAVEPKRRRWRGRAGDRGKHDSHRPFTNRKAVPGEGTVIRPSQGSAPSNCNGF